MNVRQRTKKRATKEPPSNQIYMQLFLFLVQKENKNKNKK